MIPAPHSQRCEHECVCMWLLDFERNRCPQTCEHDTRLSPSRIALPASLTAHYAAISAEMGKPVSELVARDLEEYQEYRRYLDNWREKVHP